MKPLLTPDRVRTLFLSGLFLLTVQFAFAQLTVTGTVTDADNGEPLIGANVLVQGTSIGTITDFDGTYELSVPEDATTLVFSYTGFTSHEVEILGRSIIDVALNPGTELEEIVVTGYGTALRREVTSAITSVKEEDFNRGNVIDPAQLLQGKATGLSIAKDNGGNPNAGYTIRIRGLSTVGDNVEPLIIIDGVPSSSLSQVDPSDISAIDVLKDGAAAAIYGTRGSNGVIIVTTKSGLPGQRLTVDYNGYLSSERIAESVPVLDAEGFRRYYPAGDKGATTDWFDEISQTALTQNHNLGLTGGSGKTTYRISFNYRDVEGIQRKTGWERTNSRINIEQLALDDKLTITGNLALSSQKSQFGFDEIFRYATVYNPTEPIRVTAQDNESGLNPDNFTRWDGYYQNVQFDYYNPVAIIEQNINEGTSSRVDFNIKGDYEFIPNLHGNISYAVQRHDRFQGVYWDKNSFLVGADRNGLAERRNDDSFTEILEITGHYDHDFNQLNLKGLVGYSWQENTNEGFRAEGGDFVTDAFTYNNLASALDFDNGLGTLESYKNRTTLISYFARANLNWDETYYFMASFRYEGSSMFGENQKWAGFPAASAGVVLSNIWDMGGIDNLKFRASYGETGTLPADPYLSIARLGPVGNAYINGAFQPAIGPSSNANPNLKWEEKQEWDLGLDIALLDYRLTASFDYYERKTTDALFLFDVPVPPNLFGQTWLNIGRIDNRGFELGINWEAINTVNLRYSTGVTFSTYKTELVSLSSDEENLQFGEQRIINDLGSPGQNGTLITLVREGAEIGNIWGPVMGSPVVDENGDWNILDTDGNGVVNRDDEQIIGNGLPDYEIGWSNQVTFGNWDLNVFFRGVFGHDLLNTYRAFYENPNLIQSYNVLESSFDGQLDGLNGNVNKYGSFHVESGSYFKLDNISLGYNFQMPAGSRIRNFRVYATGQNLFVITDYSGVDPEVRYADYVNEAGVLGAGIDRRNTWFRTRTATIGVQLGF